MRKTTLFPQRLFSLALIAMALFFSGCSNGNSEDLTSLDSLYIYTQDWDQTKTATAERAAIIDFGRYGELTYNSANFSKVAGRVAYFLDAETDQGMVVATAQSKIGNLRVYLTQISGEEKYQAGGIATAVDLFGNLHPNPLSGIPLLPKAKASIAAWGKADVYLRGIYLGDFNAAFWRGPGIHDEEGKVWQTAEKKNFFDPATPNQSYVNEQEEEIHLLLSTEQKGYPIRYWHLLYEDIHDPSPSNEK